MKEIIDAETWKAIGHQGDEATMEFYRRLKEKRLCSTRCDACGETAYPPRSFCPFCHGRKVSWVDLPKRATLYAFTQQHRSLRFPAPDVIGLVEVAGVGHFLSRIDAPCDALAIGQELEVSFFEVTPDLWMHQYRPTSQPASR
jgi:uncharacterized OB-fold protein